MQCISSYKIACNSFQALNINCKGSHMRKVESMRLAQGLSINPSHCLYMPGCYNTHDVIKQYKGLGFHDHNELDGLI